MSNPILTYLPLNGTLAMRDRLSPNLSSAVGSGALRWQPAENARVNYCINSRFANNTDGWATNGGSGASITRIADSRFAGGFACRVVAPNDTSYRGLLQSAASVPLNIPAYSITQITISFDIIVESGPLTGLKTGIQTYSANNAYVISSGSAIFSVSAFDTIERKSVTVTLNTDNFYKGDKFVVLVTNGQLSTSQFLISNIVVEYGDVPNATYFDGAMPGCSFLEPRTGQLGSAHASPSCNQVAAWIEEGTTNLITNPAFAVSTAGWVAASGASIARSTARAYMGPASGYGVAATALRIYHSQVFAVTPGEVITCSAVVASDQTPNFRVHIYINDASDTYLTSVVSTVVPLTKAWSVVSMTATMPALSASIRVNVELVSPSAGDTLYIGFVQLEKKAYKTSFCPAIDSSGAIADGYSWAGTAHASSSTRAATTLSFATVNRLFLASGEVLLRQMSLTTNPADNNYAFSHVLSGTNRIYLYRSLSGRRMSVGLGGTSTLAQESSTLADGVWWTGSVAWHNGTGWLYNKTSQVGSGTYTGLSSLAASADIGERNGGADGYLNGLIGPIATFSRELTDTERAAYNARIDSWQDLWSLYEQTIGGIVRVAATEPYSLIRTGGPGPSLVA